jgi:hypothetical protein
MERISLPDAKQIRLTFRLLRQEDNMHQLSERVWFERYRLVVISAWPESEAKRAAMSSARAALEREVAFAESRRATSQM